MPLTTIGFAHPQLPGRVGVDLFHSGRQMLDRSADQQSDSGVLGDQRVGDASA